MEVSRKETLMTIVFWDQNIFNLWIEISKCLLLTSTVNKYYYPLKALWLEPVRLICKEFVDRRSSSLFQSMKMVPFTKTSFCQLDSKLLQRSNGISTCCLGFLMENMFCALCGLLLSHYCHWELCVHVIRPGKLHSQKSCFHTYIIFIHSEGIMKRN